MILQGELPNLRAAIQDERPVDLPTFVFPKMTQHSGSLPEVSALPVHL